MLKILQQFKWPMAIVAVAALVIWTLTVALGDTLGVSPEIQEMVASIASRIGSAIVAFIIPLLSQDSDGDGTPDIAED